MGFVDQLLVRSLPLAPKALVWRVARRYVAGTDLAAAVATVRRLNGEGCMATIDVLGEEVRDPAVAAGFVDEYLRVYEAIAREGLDSNVSIKPTMLGLSIDEELCRENVERLAAKALELGNFLRIDMEDRTTTDATLRIFRDLKERYGCVGVVLQAYMRRTLADIAALPAEGTNVRLCKGIYIEPRPVAWKGYETVRAAFVAALEKLFARGIYVGIATHDEYLVMRSCEIVDRLGLPRDRYEFQMLLGVEDELRHVLVAAGHRLRVYVPYGVDWYAYSVRRMRENPEIAGHVLRAFLGRR